MKTKIQKEMKESIEYNIECLLFFLTNPNCVCYLRLNTERMIPVATPTFKDSVAYSV